MQREGQEPSPCELAIPERTGSLIAEGFTALLRGEVARRAVQEELAQASQCFSQGKRHLAQAARLMQQMYGGQFQP